MRLITIFYGPEIDKVVADYRELTGQAPMFGKWAYGFWQCKNRYKSQDEILGVARKYRELHIPADDIVQDWFWWNRKGEFVFNKNYPDPKSMVDQLHAENFHLMLSIWPFFEPGSSNYDYMKKQAWFVDQFKYAKPPYHTDAMAVYDATNPEARKFYWDQLNKSLFNIGIDAWWMDTTEPETEGQEENILLNHKLAAGSEIAMSTTIPCSILLPFIRDSARPQTRSASSFCRARRFRDRREIPSPRGRETSTPIG